MRVRVSVHAALRFEERVRPGLARRAACVELERLVREFGRRVPPPGWCPPLRGDRFVVEVADGVLVVCRRVGRGVPEALTVLTRAGMDESCRARRNHRRAVKRAGRAARSRGTLGGRPRLGRHFDRSNFGEL